MDNGQITFMLDPGLEEAVNKWREEQVLPVSMSTLINCAVREYIACKRVCKVEEYSVALRKMMERHKDELDKLI